MVRIVCDVQIDGDSLIGRVSRRGGETHDFSGWLGLLGALQVLLAPTDHSPATHGESPPASESEPRPDKPNEG